MVINSDTDSGRSRRIPAEDDAIGRFLAGLLGHKLDVLPARAGEFDASGAVVAAYAESGEAAVALCIFDVDFAASLAMTASIIESRQLEKALEKRRIEGVLRSRLNALCELLGSLFPVFPAGVDDHLLVLRDVRDLDEARADVAALRANPGTRRDVRLSIAGNGGGHLVLITR